MHGTKKLTKKSDAHFHFRQQNDFEALVCVHSTAQGLEDYVRCRGETVWLMMG